MELIAAIGAGPVAIDSAVFIYFIERNPRYVPLLRPLFTLIDSGEIAAVTSSLTLLETLVVPYRTGDTELAATYESILTNGRGLALVPMHLPVIRLAARIRAVTSSVRTADAIQLATALLMNCMTFLTNDARLRAISGIKVLQLDAFVPSA